MEKRDFRYAMLILLVIIMVLLVIRPAAQKQSKALLSFLKTEKNLRRFLPFPQK